ncbi:MAG: MoaD/ThiS family protein [Aquisalimonadaceae bacterium]
MLQIEFHGVLQQAAGGRTMELDGVASGATVADVLERLKGERPALAAHLPRVACAQGDSLVRHNREVDIHRPLVLLPPVSGGSAEETGQQ